MQKIYVFMLSLVLFSFQQIQGQNPISISLKPQQSAVTLSKVNDNGLDLNASFSQLKLTPVQTKKGLFYRLEVPGLIKTYNEGIPEIPVISKLIELPLEADVEFEVVSFDEEIIKLSDYGIQGKIIPAQKSLSKSESLQELKIKEEVYKMNEFLFQQTGKFYNSGIMRGTRLGRIEVYPIQYNPEKNTLKILNNLVLRVKFVNGDMQKTKALKKKVYSPVFGNLLKNSLANYSAPGELITQAPVHYVIVSDRIFETQLAPFIEWKTKKGFKVTVGYTDVIGSTKDAIKNWLQNIYQGPDPMSYVLFVGDVQQIPAWNGNSGSHVTDLRYCEYTGDNLPEVYYGRFSASTTAELQPQIDKTLMYEKYLMPDPSYLDEVFLVAGDDAAHEDTWGNGQVNYGTDNYFNAANNLSTHAFLQDPPNGNAAVHDSIIANVNNGLAFANYTAHCSPDGWAEPSFSVNDVNGLNNDGKYGIWIGNCCLSNKFDDNECFGEAALRKANGGAVGYIGGSNSTYWDEDYWWGVGLTSAITANPTYLDSGRGAFDGMMHTLANEVNDPTTWYPAQGQIQVCGNLSVESSTSTAKEYYWEIYHLMGDPSVMNYIGIPQPMSVNLTPSTILAGMTSLTVTSVPYGYVGLSQNGTLIAAALSDSAGNAVLNFDANDLTIGTADIVVTAQNWQPYIGTISVSPANEPYVVLNSYTTSAAPDFDSSIDLNVILENVAATGSGYDADNVVAVISSSDPYVTINDNTENYGTIVAGNTVSVNAAYSITIADNVPDQHVIGLDMTITDSANHTWNAVINLVANAPDISIDNVAIINDTNNNNILDPGETADLSFNITNTGHADAVFNGNLSAPGNPNNYLVLGNTLVSGINIPAGQSHDFVFTGASADANTPVGTTVGIQLDVTAGNNNQYNKNSNQDIIIGLIPEYSISNGGTLTVCSGTFYDSGLDTGNYADDENYTISFLPPAGEEFIIVDFVSFDVENNYDFLYVYMGPDTSAPQMPGSPFTGNNSPGTIQSTTGITFRFTSDYMTNASGWEANVSCYTPTTPPACPSNPVPADQANNVFPYEISWDTVDYASSYEVYFGTDPDPMNNTPVSVTTNMLNVNTVPNTTYYWTVLPANSAGSASGCNIWSFTTGNAQYNMGSTQTVSTCDAMFYDNGGPNQNYDNSLTQTMTFLPENANSVISAYFNSFNLEDGYDFLKIYDGTDTNAPLIGEFSGEGAVPSALQPVTASNTDGALTFEFSSDTSVNKAGWEAEISCIVVNALEENAARKLQIYPNPNEGNFVIKSTGFDGPYEVKIFTAGGKQIYQNRFNGENAAIQLNEYSKGIYFVKLISEKHVYHAKIIIK